MTVGLGWLALVATLKSVREKTRNKVQKIKNIMDLYQDRKIVHFGTAEKLILQVSDITAINDEKEKKGVKAYDKAVQKYQTAVPIG